MKIRNVLSLFDGISCGKLALENMGISFDNYFASEIDKYAISVSKFNHPGIIQLGDINEWEAWELDYSKIDLVMAGFPCVSWSIQGKREGVEDVKGKLVYPLLKILRTIQDQNPDVKFLFENVEMKEVFRDFLSDLIGVQPFAINSRRFSAQNRGRLYWTNIGSPAPFGSIIIPPSNDSLIRDVLEDHKDIPKEFFYECGFDLTGKIKGHVATLHINNLETYKRVYSIDSKAPTLTTMQGGHRHPKIMVGGKIRRMSPLECERLQTLPDNYTTTGIMNGKKVKISNSQRYKTIGNGWTVKVIERILSPLSEFDLNV